METGFALARSLRRLGPEAGVGRRGATQVKGQGQHRCRRKQLVSKRQNEDS